MLRFLLDNHIPPAVAEGMRLRRPTCMIGSLSTWREGSFRTRADADILSAAHEEALTLVTYDQRTIRPLAARWSGQRKDHGGIVFASEKTIRSRDVGSLVRALEYLWDTRGHEDWTNVVDYLTRPP